MSQSDWPRDDAAAKLGELLPPAAVDALLADAEASGTPIDGPDGLLAQMTKAVLERALDVEIADHLGYEHGDPAGYGSGNSRNGHGGKTVLTTAGPVDLEVPRDRNGTFAPAIVPKRKRRLGQVEDMILSLYARGMSTRDITEHLGEVYGASVSAATISRVTDVVVDEIAAWQSRPVDPVYPILYIDAIRIKIRDGGVVANKAAHVVIGVDIDGIKQVLGIWIQQSEGAKFWHGVLTELRNRGCRDALFVCCDGLAGLPESIAAIWPQAIVQTCVVHLLTELTPELLQLRAGVVMVPRHGRAGGGPTGSGGSGGRSRRFVGGHRRRVAAVAAAGSVRRAGCGGGCVLAGSQRGWPVLGDATVVWAGVVAVVPVLVVGPGAVESGDPGGSS